MYPWVRKMKGSHYTQEELSEVGFAAWGRNVLISRKASFYGAERIRFGSHVRIDDFCVLSAGEGGIDIGDHVHIAVYSSLIGRGRIELHDFSGLSSRGSIYSSNDDYSGKSMTNPMVPEEFTGMSHSDVVVGRHVIVGSGSIVLPGVVLEEGVAVGALSLVRRSCSAFGIYSGMPAKRIGERNRGLLELEQQLRSREDM